MFGYVKPCRPELLVKEDTMYKSVYCALCKNMGKRYGILSRFSLNYDCTFLAIVIVAMKRNENTLNFERKRCTTNPFKKCGYLCFVKDELDYAAAVSEMLTYWKIKDDIDDSAFIKRLISRFALLFYSGKRKKAKKFYPSVDTIIGDAVKYQKAAEKSDDFSIDASAAPTAEMLSSLFSLGFEGTDKRLLEELGYHLGRWIYFIDAADDIEKDLISGSFNPFIIAYKITEKDYLENRASINAKCNEVLNFSLVEALRASELLPYKSFASIIENIIARGLPDMQRNVLFTDRKKGSKT